MSYYDIDDCNVAMCQPHSGPSNRQEGILPLARAIPLHTGNNEFERMLSIRLRRIKRQIYGLSFLSLYYYILFLETNFWFTWYIYDLTTINNQKIKEQCPMIKGNADMYGIGIRIAIYLQMVYTIFVQCCSPKHLALVGPINIWFLFALVVVMCTTLWAGGDVHPAELFMLHILGNGLKGLVLGPVFRELPEALAFDNQFTSFARVIVSGIWVGCCSNLWWSAYPRALADTNECYPIGLDWINYSRAFNILEWCDIASLFLPQLWAITITAHITRTRLDVKLYIAGLVKGQVASQHTPHITDFPSKMQIFLDCLFIFPSGDLNWIIYGDEFKLASEATDLHRNKPWTLCKEFVLGLLHPIPGPNPLVKISTDTDIAYSRLFNYLIQKYDMPKDLRVSSVQCRQGTYDFWGKSRRALYAPFGPNISHHDDPQIDTKVSAYSLWIHWNVVLIVITVTVAEVTLVQNNIVEVNDMLSPGQLIAFIVAIGACLTVAMQVRVDDRKKLYGAALHVAADCYYLNELRKQEQEGEQGFCTGKDAHCQIEQKATQRGGCAR